MIGLNIAAHGSMLESITQRCRYYASQVVLFQEFEGGEGVTMSQENSRNRSGSRANCSKRFHSFFTIERCFGESLCDVRMQGSSNPAERGCAG